LNEEARINFQAKIEGSQKTGKQLIYVDESGFSSDMSRKHRVTLLYAEF